MRLLNLKDGLHAFFWRPCAAQFVYLALSKTPKTLRSHMSVRTNTVSLGPRTVVLRRSKSVETFVKDLQIGFHSQRV